MQAICRDAGIDLLVLKGPHLAYTVWPVPTERVWCDLDILARPDQFDAAIEALTRQDFKQPPFDRRHRASAPCYHNIALQGPYGIHIELHRDLTPHGRYPVSIEDLFCRAETFWFLETEARGLAPADLLLHLCLHMMKSYFCAVERKHIRDIALVVTRRTIDWRLFLSNAGAAGARTGCWVALRAAATQHGAVVPERVLTDLTPTPRRQQWLARWLDPAVFPVYRGPARSKWDYQWRLGLALMDRPLDWLPLLMKYGWLRIMDLMGRIGSSRS